MPRSFAIIPAAGLSLRMGRPKLLLPLAGRPLIAHTIDAWRQGGVSRILVTVREDHGELAAAVRSLSIDSLELVQPDQPPPDMKASIQAALRHIEHQHAPVAEDCFLIAPADMPRLSPAVIARLLTQYASTSDEILIPTVGSVRGHPALFSWNLVQEVQALGANEGLNALVGRRGATEVDCDDLVAENDRPFTDVDTFEEYRRLAGEYPTDE